MIASVVTLLGSGESPPIDDPAAFLLDHRSCFRDSSRPAPQTPTAVVGDPLHLCDDGPASCVLSCVSVIHQAVQSCAWILNLRSVHSPNRAARRSVMP